MPFKLKETDQTVKINPDTGIFFNTDTNEEYNAGIILPEITVTPKKNYIYNPYDNINIYLHERSQDKADRAAYNKYAEESSIDNKEPSDTDWADLGTSMIPIYGTYKEAKNLIEHPSWENAGWTALSLASEIPVLKGLKALKASKLLKAAKTLKKAPLITRSINKGLKKSPDLLYHLDYGDKVGAFTKHGSHIKGNKLIPGKAKDTSQLDYTWFNEGNPFSTSVNNKPLNRAIIVNKKDVPNLIRVRESTTPIGQWTGKSGFVRKSEMVTPSEVPLDNAYIYNRKELPYIGEFWLRNLTR